MNFPCQSMILPSVQPMALEELGWVFILGNVALKMRYTGKYVIEVVIQNVTD